jgi:hypothetical protein
MFENLKKYLDNKTNINQENCKFIVSDFIADIEKIIPSLLVSDNIENINKKLPFNLAVELDNALKELNEKNKTLLFYSVYNLINNFLIDEISSKVISYSKKYNKNIPYNEKIILGGDVVYLKLKNFNVINFTSALTAIQEYIKTGYKLIMLFNKHDLTKNNELIYNFLIEEIINKKMLNYDVWNISHNKSVRLTKFLLSVLDKDYIIKFFNYCINNNKQAYLEFLNEAIDYEKLNFSIYELIDLMKKSYVFPNRYLLWNMFNDFSNSLYIKNISFEEFLKIKKEFYKEGIFLKPLALLQIYIYYFYNENFNEEKIKQILTDFINNYSFTKDTYSLEKTSEFLSNLLSDKKISNKTYLELCSLLDKNKSTVTLIVDSIINSVKKIKDKDLAKAMLIDLLKQINTPIRLSDYKKLYKEFEWLQEPIFDTDTVEEKLNKRMELARIIFKICPLHDEIILENYHFLGYFLNNKHLTKPQLKFILMLMNESIVNSFSHNYCKNEFLKFLTRKDLSTQILEEMSLFNWYYRSCIYCSPKFFEKILKNFLTNVNIKDYMVLNVIDNIVLYSVNEYELLKEIKETLKYLLYNPSINNDDSLKMILIENGVQLCQPYMLDI